MQGVQGLVPHEIGPQETKTCLLHSLQCEPPHEYAVTSPWLQMNVARNRDERLREPSLGSFHCHALSQQRRQQQQQLEEALHCCAQR